MGVIVPGVVGEVVEDGLVIVDGSVGVVGVIVSVVLVEGVVDGIVDIVPPLLLFPRRDFIILPERLVDVVDIVLSVVLVWGDIVPAVEPGVVCPDIEPDVVVWALAIEGNAVIAAAAIIVMLRIFSLLGLWRTNPGSWMKFRRFRRDERKPRRNSGLADDPHATLPAME